MPPKIKLLGICGSPIANGNTQKILEHALTSAEKLQNVETDIFLTAKKNSAPVSIATGACLRGSTGNIAPSRMIYSRFSQRY